MEKNTGGQYKVLIVEDDPMVAMINEQYVGRNPDFTVKGSVRNGKDAIDFLENNEIDLVVLDVFMPYMDGIETLRKIREQNYPTEVIMVTAANDTTTLEQTLNYGVLDYLVKPFNLERFLVALEKFTLKMRSLSCNKCETLDQSRIDSIMSGGNKIEKGNGKLSSERESSVEGGQNLSYSYDGSASNLNNALTSKEKSLNSGNLPLPKGIQKKTLELIKNYFSENPGWQSGDTVSHKLGLSIVTVRHYLNYLVESKELTECINYETGGRPSSLYKI